MQSGKLALLPGYPQITALAKLTSESVLWMVTLPPGAANPEADKPAESL